MNKEMILNYAKGGKIEPSYYIQYEVKDEKIVIGCCDVITNKNHDVLFRMVLTGESTPVSPDDVRQAAKEFMKSHPPRERELHGEFWDTGGKIEMKI